MRILMQGVVAAAAAAGVARAASGQKLPPVHFIDRPVATSKHVFRTIGSVRHLPNGSVLVNDQSHRQLVLLDSALALVSVVADSTPGSANAYGPPGAGLIAYPGDSSLLVLPRVPSMYMIDPTGHIVRTMSVPRPQEAASMASMTSGVPGFDRQGRWIYRGQTPPAKRVEPVLGGAPGSMIGADSAPIVRMNPTTHAIDTIAMFRLNQFKFKLYAREGGRTMAMGESNPVPLVDDWAVLADGSVAVVRGQDYHIDFITADGVVTRGPKMAYAWEPLGDDAKVKLMDSVRAEAEKPADPNKTPTTLAGGSPSTGGGGGTAGGAAAVSGGLPADMPPREYANPSDLPDYRPPFTSSAARPDADDNLWIRTTHREKSAGYVYDVVNRQGKVIDRVQLQPGRAVLGFGPAGIVYLVATDDTVTWIEKTNWRAPRE